MKIIINYNTTHFVIDITEWVISGSTGEYINGKAVYYEIPKKIEIPKSNIKTINDLTFLISVIQKIPKCAVYFIHNGVVLPKQTELYDNMNVTLFYKTIECKKHFNCC